MRAEFIAFKYAGVPTVSELKKDAESFGWKCRKYSNWKQVHVERGDAKRLHQMANALIDKGEVDCEVYGRVSEIWLQIQRWRLDKKGMQVDPPKKTAWVELNTSIKVAAEHPHSIISTLVSKGLSDRYGSHDASVLFLIHQLTELMQKLSICPSEEVMGIINGHSLGKDQINRAVNLVAEQLYCEQCSEICRKGKGLEVLNHVFEGLDINAFHAPESLPYEEVDLEGEPTVIVEYAKLSNDKVVDIRMAKGKTIVVLNKRHLGLSNLLDKSEPEIIQIIFGALGATANDMATRDKDVKDFLALFSLHLIQLSTGGVLFSREVVN